MTTPEKVEPVGILLCKDLFFVAGVTATARSLELPMRVCPGLSPFAKMLEESPQVKAVILDMGMIEPGNTAVWENLRTLVKPPMILAGFGSNPRSSNFENWWIAVQITIVINCLTLLVEHRSGH